MIRKLYTIFGCEFLMKCFDDGVLFGSHLPPTTEWGCKQHGGMYWALIDDGILRNYLLDAIVPVELSR